MAERFVRMAGPGAASTDPVNPSVLFTVPDNKLYVIRDVTLVALPTSGGLSANVTCHVATDTRDVAAVSATPTALADTDRFTGSMPIYAGEQVTAYIDGEPTTLSYLLNINKNLEDTDEAQWQAAGQEIVDTPMVFYFFGDGYNTGTASLLTGFDTMTADAGSFTIHQNIATPAGPSTGLSHPLSLATITVNTDFDGAENFRFTWTTPNTQVFGWGIEFYGIPLPGVPLQSTNNSGTGGSTASCTMTPQSVDNIQIIYVQGTDDSGLGSWTTPSGATVVHSADLTGSSKMALYAMDSSNAMTNPSVSYTGDTLDTWGIIACEVPTTAGAHAITVSGIVIE